MKHSLRMKNVSALRPFKKGLAKGRDEHSSLWAQLHEIYPLLVTHISVLGFVL